MQSGLEVRPQHRDLGGPYGGPGPAPGSVPAFGAQELPAQERVQTQLLSQGGLQNRATTSTAERKESPVFREAQYRPGPSRKSWCMKVYLKANTSAHIIKPMYKLNWSPIPPLQNNE